MPVVFFLDIFGFHLISEASLCWSTYDATAQIPEISLEYGKQQEFKGEYAAALSLYQQSQRSLQGKEPPTPAMVAAISGGLARYVSKRHASFVFPVPVLLRLLGRDVCYLALVFSIDNRDLVSGKMACRYP